MLKKIKIQNYLFFVTIFSFLLFFSSSSIYAESSVVISQIQTSGPGTGTADQEFIELYNNSTKSVDLNGWQLRYITSSGSLLTAKNFANIPSELKIHPKGFVLIASESFRPELTNAFRYKIGSFSGLSYDGATVDLIDPSGNIIDRVGYGAKTTILSETAAAVAPEKAGSIIRKMNDGQAVDTDNNSLDFEALSIASPRTKNEAPIVETPVSEPPVEEPTNPPSPEQDPANNTGNTGSTTDQSGDNQSATPPEVIVQPPILNLKISELMIDPEFPLVDSSDEWVEIYNPNNQEVDLSGYRLEAGNSGSYKYMFEKTKIPAKSFLVVKSVDTPISLSNTSGKVSLYDASNKLIDSVSYQSVEPGLAYANDSSGLWQWTTTPTENSENIITLKVISPAVLAKSTSPKTATKAKTATTAKAKAAAKTAAAPKTAKSKAVKTTQVKAAQTDKPLIAVSNPIPNSVIAILLVVAIIYSVYEYRYELRNKIVQLRIYGKNR